MKNILVAAVHPDDETIGCGGSIIKWLHAGHNVYWLIITNVDEAIGYKKEWVEKRQNEIDHVSKLFGFTETIKLNHPTTKLHEISYEILLKSISNVFYKVKPDTVILPNRSDVHSDHRIAFEALYSCTKSFRYPYIKKVMMMETLSETEFAPSIMSYGFNPNVFTDISDNIEKKIKIFNTYESEIMPQNQPRNERIIRALAAYRGSRIGTEYAEAFQLLFSIE